MEKSDNVNQVFELLDRYVSLTFLVKLLASHSTKNAEEFNSRVFDMDFSKLGLSDETISSLGMAPNIVQLKKHQVEISNLATEASTQVFVQISSLSMDFKIAAKEYVDGMISSYLLKSSACQDAYLKFVVDIDKSIKEGNSNKTRELGKKAKKSFNLLYEYNTICQIYSNMSSYLNGMIKGFMLKKQKSDDVDPISETLIKKR